MLNIQPVAQVVNAQGKPNAAMLQYRAKLASRGIAWNSDIESLFDTVQYHLELRSNAVTALKSHKDFHLISAPIAKRSVKIERETRVIDINGVLETVNAVVSESGTGSTRKLSLDSVIPALQRKDFGAKAQLNESLLFLVEDVKRCDVALREARLKLQNYVYEIHTQNLINARLSQLNGTHNAKPAGITVLIACGLECDIHSMTIADRTPEYMPDTSYVLRSYDAERLKRLQDKANGLGVNCTAIECILDVQGEASRGIGSKRNQVKTYSEKITDRNHKTRAYYQCTLVRCGGTALRQLTECKPQPWNVFAPLVNHAKLVSNDYYANSLPRKRSEVDKNSIGYKLAANETLTDAEYDSLAESFDKSDSNRIKRELNQAYQAIDTQAALQGLIDEALTIIGTNKADTVNAIMEREDSTRSTAWNKRYESKMTDEQRIARRAAQAESMRRLRARLKGKLESSNV